MGCRKQLNRSQPLVGWSSPYYEDMCRRYCCLTIFFRWSICALVAKIQPNKVMRWDQDGNFLRPVFPSRCVQHVSDLHLKFALRPHHVSDIHSATAEITWGKKRKIEDRKRNHRAKIWCLHLLCRAAITNLYNRITLNKNKKTQTVKFRQNKIAYKPPY